MSSRIAHLGQCTSAGQRMADECVPHMVDGKRRQSVFAQRLAVGAEAVAGYLAGKCPYLAPRS